MTDAFPNIIYNNRKNNLEVEVMTFAEVYSKLSKENIHNPYTPHKIAFYFVMVVTEGEIEHFVDFKFYTLHKGSSLFIAKNQVHHFTESFQKAKGFCIALNSAFLEDYYFLSNSIKFSSLYNYHLEAPVLHQQEMGENSFVDVIHKLKEEYNLPDTFAKHEILRAYVHVILLKAERAKQTKTNYDVQPYWLEVFDKFKNKLEDEYTQTRSSRYYATELSVSYKLLNEVVKKLTRKTIKVFIDDFVTTEIKRYLISSSLSIKEIAYITGFDEPTNFTKFFKKYTKQTPAQFRNITK